MTDLELLNKVIQKAEQRGWNKVEWHEQTGITDLKLLLKPNFIFVLIFSKDFLKSFFNKECKACRGNWQNHQLRLMLMIQKQQNPITYFKRFIKEK